MLYDKIRPPNKVTPEHLERMAYVYVRQSTLLQVREHTASTARQYDLVQRAYELGWPRERIEVIDEDQGQSGTSSADRSGFQRLVLDVSLGRVGAVLGLEASRLARCSSDWYRLLELCALTDCLVIDEDGVYDVSQFNDRIILGMKGNLSDYELHLLKSRLLGGKLRKAEQAQLRHRLPVGYIYDAAGHAILDPDEQVQHVVRLVFDLFEQRGSGLAVIKYFQEHHLLFPTRHYGGLRHGELTWNPLRHGRLLQLLHIPTYAGTYVFGRTTMRKGSFLRGASPGVRTRQVPLEEWPIVIHNIYPAYISWDQFLQHRQRLDDNRTYRDKERRGTPREGAALLQGISLCGRCGRRLTVRYDKRGWPEYDCNARHKDFGEKACQAIPGHPVDEAIGRVFLQAITPAQLAISLQTLAHLEKQAQQVERQWQLRIERVRYEAERARRQFDQTEPENRLVMRTLERAWEEKLRALEHLQREYDTRPRPKLLTVTADEQQKILELAQDLPALWQAATTTNQERKQLLRLLLQDVTLKKETTTIHLAIRWQTEAVTHLDIEKPRLASEVRRNKPELIEQVRQLAKRRSDLQIVEILKQQGMRSATGQPLNLSMVKWIRWAYHIPLACPVSPTVQKIDRRGDGRYSTQAAAKKLNVDISTILHWCKEGKLDGQQEAPHGAWWIKLTPKIIKELRQPFRRRHRSRARKRQRRSHAAR